MRHPDQVAALLRERSTWRDHSERGSRAHDAVDWEDACLMLAGCSPLAYAAFQLRYSEEVPARELVRHLLAVAGQAINGADVITPEQLVELALREERAPENQRTVAHRAAAAGVTRGRWCRHAARPYALIGAEVDALVSDAWRVVRTRTDP